MGTSACMRLLGLTIQSRRFSFTAAVDSDFQTINPERHRPYHPQPPSNRREARRSAPRNGSCFLAKSVMRRQAEPRRLSPIAEGGFWFIVATRSEDETEIRAGQSAGRTSAKGHSAPDADSIQRRRRSASRWKDCGARRIRIVSENTERIRRCPLTLSWQSKG